MKRQHQQVINVAPPDVEVLDTPSMNFDPQSVNPHGPTADELRTKSVADGQHVARFDEEGYAFDLWGRRTTATGEPVDAQGRWIDENEDPILDENGQYTYLDAEGNVMVRNSADGTLVERLDVPEMIFNKEADHAKKVHRGDNGGPEVLDLPGLEF